jgi:ATP-dependent Clp protease ATP-binding subunit ClpC
MRTGLGALRRREGTTPTRTFDRYTEAARRVLFFARYEAGLLGSAEIESEHVLLGLVRDEVRLLHDGSS